MYIGPNKIIPTNSNLPSTKYFIMLVVSVIESILLPSMLVHRRELPTVVSPQAVSLEARYSDAIILSAERSESAFQNT